MSDSLLSNALVPLFESVWARAVSIGSVRHDQITDEDRELLTMLVSGLKGEAMARRLDIHAHTVRRRITRLMQAPEYGGPVPGRVQAARRGWLTVRGRGRFGVGSRAVQSRFRGATAGSGEPKGALARCPVEANGCPGHL
ncbi:hypothetical protein [Streptomyces sp. SM11]|uniref:hypothetical protein n=1 Tax=Streptomyces sp. SM11 TaxID=565557 RepID=UPI0021566A25|nr:hypothetical protein [Streptomyces sp. SM11]